MSELSQSNYITKDLPNSRIHQTNLHKIKIGVNFELINNKLLGKPTIFIFYQTLKLIPNSEITILFHRQIQKVTISTQSAHDK